MFARQYCTDEQAAARLQTAMKDLVVVVVFSAALLHRSEFGNEEVVLFELEIGCGDTRRAETLAEIS